MGESRGLMALRRTVHFYPERLERPRGLYASMFVEDVGLMVAPIGGRARERPDFTVRVEPEDAKTRERVITALDPVARNRRDLADAVCEFVRAHASELAALGEQHFELVRAPSIGAALVTLVPWGIRRYGPLLVQTLPPAVAKRAGRRRIVLGPGQNWTLRLPSELATPRTRRGMLRGLALRVMSPTWAREAMVAGRPTAFDPPRFQRLVNERLLRRTRKWGWPAREMASADLTGYEQIRRSLVFAWALALLREHIITEVNAVFARIELGATVRLENLPTSADARVALGMLERGDRPFAEILPLVRW